MIEILVTDVSKAVFMAPSQHQLLSKGLRNMGITNPPRIDNDEKSTSPPA